MAETYLETLQQALFQSLKREPMGSGRAPSFAAWCTTRGLVRKENQDRLAIARLNSGLYLAVLADGMGGMKEGATAAAVSVSAIVAHCLSSPQIPPNELLDKAFLFANEKVYETLRADGGAVAVAIAVGPREGYVVHAGDARAYCFYKKGPLRQLTFDDTVKGQLAQLGRPATDESDLHGKLLQFIGMGKGLSPHISRIPEDGDALILATDGVHTMPPNVMGWIMSRTDHLQGLADRLVLASEWNGGYDNATAVTIGLQHKNEPLAQPSTAEVWVPGDHIILASIALRTNEVVNASRENDSINKSRKPRSKRSESRWKQGEPATTAQKLTDRQLPIVAYEDDVTVAQGNNKGSTNDTRQPADLTQEDEKK